MSAMLDNEVNDVRRANAQLQRRLEEALAERDENAAQKAAMAEIVEAINASPGDLAPVFDAILERALRLCDAAFGMMHSFDGESLHTVALRNVPNALAEVLTAAPIRPDPEGPFLGRATRKGLTIHVADLISEQPYLSRAPLAVASAELGAIRTLLHIPLVKDNAVLGVLTLFRQEVRPFTDKQIALLQNFAAQAVIAMENARLLTETREALEQQTATAEVLQVINSSPGDLAPVFDTILEKAHALCGAPLGSLVLCHGEQLRAVATRGYPKEYEAMARRGFGPTSPFRSLLKGSPFVHVLNSATPEASDNDPMRRAAVEIAGIRTALFVPLRKDAGVLGYISAQRQEEQPFSEKQIALLQNFAAQAVIAMENARLLTETREALEQQTATAEVLQVINSSPGDLAPVFDAMLEKATTLCEARLGFLSTYDGEYFRAVATRGVPEKYLEDFLRGPYLPGPNTTHDRLVRGERVVHVTDLTNDKADSPRRRAVVELLGVRTILGVPLYMDDALVGAFHVYRQEVRPFSEKQIALLQNFAAQAVIAMENARLLGELRERTSDLQESLEYQTATSDVLKVISRSTFDLQPVLDTVCETAVRLCNSDMAGLVTRDGDVYRVTASYAMSPEWDALQPSLSFAPGRDTVAGRTLLERRVVQIADITADPEYALSEAATVGKIRTILGVPLLREGQPVGVIVLSRQRVEPFTQRQIELVRTFADQAVIAIENTRLITETREALEQLTATAEVLGVINSSPGDLGPVFDAMLEKATRLCEAPFGILRTWDGERFHFGAAHGDPQFCDWVRQRGPIRPDRDASLLGRIQTGERVVCVADAQDDEGYRASSGFREMAEASGIRSAVTVALHKDDALLGIITVYRQEVRPFTDKQISLLQNFAAQAVIAMENARLITETREALEQQTATAEVLQVINSSPGDLGPVFDSMLEKAHKLCGVVQGSLQLFDGHNFRAVAVRGLPEPFAQRLRDGIWDSNTPVTQPLISGARFTHIPDIGEIDHPVARAVVERGNTRTLLCVPLRKGNALLGMIVSARPDVRPFTDKQIALLENFAAQAVIAMENARLINETREALEQQTATAEVLQVINASPGDLAPVFDALLEKAMRLCGAAFGELRTYDGQRFNLAAVHGVPSTYVDYYRAHNTGIYGSGTGPTQLLAGKPLVHIPDLTATEPYQQGDPDRRALVDLGGARSYLMVPLLRDRTVLGYIMIYRQEPGFFSDKQIALLQNFAAPAVIAMENARLITETREALEQQTATAEVLAVINSSPGDLAPVFDAMLDKATRLCEAAYGILWTYDGEHFRAESLRGAIPTAFAVFLAQPIHAGKDTGIGRIARGERVIRIDDLAAEIGYASGDPLHRAGVELGGLRSVLIVRLEKDGVLLGAFSIYRQEVRPFSDKQVALVQGFAAQAVIAIENGRLLSEIRQRQAELRVTFDNMVDGVAMFDEDLRLAAWNRNFQELLDLPDALLSGRPSYADYVRILADRGEFGTDNVEAELSRRLEHTDQEFRDERTRPDGRVIEVHRNAVPGGGFVLIYSDITERKRSEAEIHAARDAAEAAYRDLKAAQANLIQAEKMASLGQLTAGIAHEIKNPLNFVNNFAGLCVELLDELKETAASAITALDEDKRAEVDETIEMLTGNLEKIAEHGRRADNIVKGMLEHSRGSSGERRSVDLNGLIEEALSLAYHGGRAQDQNFNITLERDYAEALPPIELVPQDITRVCLNLFTNGFYATTKRQREGGDPNFKPTLKVLTRDLGDAVEIRVRDNGTGIPPEIKDKLFQPFFTTKPTGEGTGLGLSISYDIVTQQHGGTIQVDSRVGEFTEFTIRLPRAYRVTMAEAAS